MGQGTELGKMRFISLESVEENFRFKLDGCLGLGLQQQYETKGEIRFDYVRMQFLSYLFEKQMIRRKIFSYSLLEKRTEILFGDY